MDSTQGCLTKADPASVNNEYLTCQQKNPPSAPKTATSPRGSGSPLVADGFYWTLSIKEELMICPHRFYPTQTQRQTYIDTHCVTCFSSLLLSLFFSHTSGQIVGTSPHIFLHYQHMKIWLLQSSYYVDELCFTQLIPGGGFHIFLVCVCVFILICFLL